MFCSWLLQDESKLYIFLELVSQGSLLKLYQRYHLLDSQVSSYTRQILHGLKYLHDRNVVHRWLHIFSFVIYLCDTRLFGYLALNWFWNSCCLEYMFLIMSLLILAFSELCCKSYPPSSYQKDFLFFFFLCVWEGGGKCYVILRMSVLHALPTQLIDGLSDKGLLCMSPWRISLESHHQKKV